MKRETQKALSLAMKMMKWANKNGLYSHISLNAHYGQVTFECQADSYRNAHLFKKEFKEVGRFKRISSDTLKYTAHLKDINLGISLYAIDKLPPSCKIIYEEIEVPYQESIEAHTETIAKIACGNGEKEAVSA